MCFDGCTSGILDNFFYSSITVENASQAVFAQRDHSQFDSLLPHDDGGRAFINQGADGIRNLQELENTFASLIAGVIAVGAAAPVIKHLFSKVMRGEVQQSKLTLGRLKRSSAVFAGGPHQSLPNHADEGGGN